MVRSSSYNGVAPLEYLVEELYVKTIYAKVV